MKKTNPIGKGRGKGGKGGTEGGKGCKGSKEGMAYHSGRIVENSRMEAGKGGKGSKGGMSRHSGYSDDNSPAARQRRFFDKLCKYPDAKISDEEEALKLFKGAIRFGVEDPKELLYKLNDSQTKDSNALQKALEYLGNDDLQLFRKGVIPVIRILGSPDIDKPVYKKPLIAVLRDLAIECNGIVLESAFDLVQCGSFTEEERAVIMWLCLTLACDDASFRQNSHIQKISSLLSRSSGEAGIKLLTVLAGGTSLFTGSSNAARNVELVGNQLPGGRHDNDYADYREIWIEPTLEEFASLNDCEPYLPKPSAAQLSVCSDGHGEAQLLDRQFRLLRHDMLGPMIDTVSGSHSSNHEVFDSVRVNKLCYEPEPCFIFSFILSTCSRMNEAAKRDYWQKHSRVLPKNALVCLLRKSGKGSWSPVRFGIIKRREVDDLAKQFSEIGIQFNGGAIQATIEELSHSPPTKLVVVSSSFFAYKPILEGLKSIQTVPFREELVYGRVQEIEIGALKCSSETKTKIERLDASQQRALDHALSRRVALIQGPPGTGKTYIGALVASLLLSSTDHTILVVCYTNHALDSFLEDLINNGITDIVRVGGRSKNANIEKYSLYELAGGRSTFSASQKRRFGQLKGEIEYAQDKVESCLKNCYMKIERVPWRIVEPWLEDEHRVAYKALKLTSDDIQKVSGYVAKGLKGTDYLWRQWLHGNGPQPYDGRSHLPLWKLSQIERNEIAMRWQKEMIETARDELVYYLDVIKQAQEEISLLKKQNHEEILRSRRVIGITTTKAAMEKDLLDAVAPGIVLIEEAAEIMEAHVLTSISPSCERLVMIGDHKQLRPKCEFYPLTIESGRGHNLNRSLFERLAGSLDVATLSTQHRMHPDISAIAKLTTYPSLADAASVLAHPPITGVSQRVTFIDHEYPEDGNNGFSERAEAVSKTNAHELTMTVSIVKYLLQQGYKSTDLVVLTPYLGQLVRIQKALSDAKLNVIINDADMSEAFDRLGKVVDIERGAMKRPHIDRNDSVRVATIDNYQGEEANIAVISLVRGCSKTPGSTQRSNIGFLKEPQRVNVLFTRAKHGMIVLGNRSTFEETGGVVWRKIYGHGDVYNYNCSGLPVICMEHSTRAVLAKPGDFEKHCPKGGCTKKCKRLLKCTHQCDLVCHPRSSCQTKCSVKVPAICLRGEHNTLRLCSTPNPPLCKEGVMVTCEGLSGTVHQFESPCHVLRPNCKRCKKIEALDKKLKEETKKMEVEMRKAEEEMEERGKKARNEAAILEKRRLHFESKQAADLKQKKLEIQNLREKREQALREENAGVEIEEEVRKMHLEAEAEVISLEARLKDERSTRARQAQIEMTRIEDARKKDLMKKQAEMDSLKASTDKLIRDVKKELEKERDTSEAHVRREKEIHAQERRKIEEKRVAAKAQREKAEKAAVDQERQKSFRLRHSAAAEIRENDRLRAAAEQDPKTQAELGRRERECQVCYDDSVLEVNGFMCKGNHFLCDECFTLQVRAESNEELQELEARNGEILCTFCDKADRLPVSMADIVLHAGNEAFQEYSDAKKMLLESQLAKEIRKEERKRMQDEMERLARMDAYEREVYEHCRHVRENILTLKCPREGCGLAFLDFDGCFALTCSKCRCGFCAWCLEDCGDDAHAHVANCPEGRGIAGDPYGTKDAFTEAQAKRRKRVVRGFLRGIDDVKMREDIANQCRKDFEDLDMQEISDEFCGGGQRDGGNRDNEHDADFLLAQQLEQEELDDEYYEDFDYD